jgi:vanillate O-demethylase monooxygenase subunit
MENLIDLAHVSIVHAGLLRSATDTEIAEYRVDVDESGIVSTYTQPGSTIYVGAAPEQSSREDWVRFPFTSFIRMRFAHGMTVLFFAVKPVSERETVIWHLRGRDFDLKKPDADFIELDTAVFEQDRQMVEGQRPEMLPVDLTEELHIKGVDAASVEYRRMLKRKTGLMYA